MFFLFIRCFLCLSPSVLFGVAISTSASDFDDGLMMNQEEQNYFLLAVSDAIEDHPITKESLSLVAQSEATLEFAKANNNLEVKLHGNTRTSLDQKFEDRRSTVFESSRERHRADASLVLHQTLFDERIKREISKQEKLVQAEFLASQQKVAELTLQMILSCHSTAVFHRIGNLIGAFITRHRVISEQIRKRVMSGHTAAAELTRTNARLAEAEAKKMVMDLRLRKSIAEFTQLLPETLPCKKLFPIDADAFSSEYKIFLDGKKNNFSLLRAYRLIEAAEQELERAKANFKPKLIAELRGDRYDLSGDRNYDIYGSLNVTLDLYTGGRKSAMIRVAAEQLQGARARKDVLEEELALQLEENFAELSNGEDRIKALVVANEAYAKSRDLLRLQFESANVSLLELLEAERDHLESGESLLTNYKSIVAAQARQLFMLGELNGYLNKRLTRD